MEKQPVSGDEMLKPFQIRDLLDDDEASSTSSSEGRLDVDERSCSTPKNEPSKLQTRDARSGIVQVTSSEYDETVKRNPQAKLLYTDEDDGESITVGSSLELAQRLDEPLPQRLPSTKALRRRHVSQTSNGDQAMHIFDLPRLPDALTTWRAIHRRCRFDPGPQSVGSKSADRQVPLTKDESSSDMGKALSSSKDMAPTHWNDDFHDARRRWVRHCNPPVLHDTRNTKEDDCTTAPETVNSSSKDFKSENGQSYMTEEGRKVANAAGANLRNSRNLLSGSQASSFALPSPAQNFWSSQSKAEKTHDFNPKPGVQPKPAGGGLPKEDQSQPLLSAFEAELAKLVQEDAASEHSPEPDQTSETSQNNSAESTEPHPSEPEPTNPSSPPRGEAVAQTMQSLLRGISHMASDLGTLLPEAERRLHGLQHQVPAQMESSVNTALHGMRNHAQTLANTLQDATLSTRTAAERARETQILASAQVEGLWNIAHELGQVCTSALSSFNSRPTSQSAGTQPQVAEQTLTTSQAQCSGNQEESSQQAASPTTVSHGQTRLSCDTTLFIGNLPSTATEEMLHSLFASQGFLGRINLPVNSVTGTHEGFGYAKFPSTFAASGALQALQGTDFDGKTLNVEVSIGPISEDSDRAAENQPPSNIEGEEEQTAPKPSENLATRTSSLKPSVVRRDGVPKKRQSVNFAVPSEDTAAPSVTRPMTALEELRQHRKRVSESSSRNRYSQPPAVPPKERLDGQNTNSKDNATNAQNTTFASLLDQDNTLADFSARYPPVVSPHGLQDAPTNSQEPVGHARRLREVNAGSSTTLPGSFPQSEQYDPPRRSLTTSQVPFIRPRSPPRYASETRRISPFRPHQSAVTPPVVNDRLPGAWPEENVPRDKSDDENHPTLPTMNPMRSSQRPTGHQKAQQRDAPYGPSELSRSVRRSATERRPHNRHSVFGRSPARHSSYHELQPARIAPIPGAFPTGNQSSVSLPSQGVHVTQPEMTENNLGSNIDICVGHLKALGFAGGDMSLLKFYAEAADGNLSDAIEYMEDERKALEQQESLLG